MPVGPQAKTMYFFAVNFIITAIKKVRPGQPMMVVLFLYLITFICDHGAGLG
jgi:hypothetical protein